MHTERLTRDLDLAKKRRTRPREIEGMLSDMLRQRRVAAEKDHDLDEEDEHCVLLVPWMAPLVPIRICMQLPVSCHLYGASGISVCEVCFAATVMQVGNWRMISVLFCSPPFSSPSP